MTTSEAKITNTYYNIRECIDEKLKTCETLEAQEIINYLQAHLEDLGEYYQARYKHEYSNR